MSNITCVNNLSKNIINFFLDQLSIVLDIHYISTHCHSSNEPRDILSNSTLFHPLVICNHVSELDPFLLFFIFQENKKIYRFISDISIKDIPIFGYIAEFYNTIFVNSHYHNTPTRNLRQLSFEMPSFGSGLSDNDDLVCTSSLRKGVNCLTNTPIRRVKPIRGSYNHTQRMNNRTLEMEISKTDNICIFPEGTIYFKKTINRSNRFCKNKLKIPNFKNVLCPRVNGFATVNRILQPDKITDITLEYIYLDNPDFLQNNKVPLTIAFILLYPPSKIIITIREKTIESENPELFIMNIFREKDAFIESHIPAKM